MCTPTFGGPKTHTLTLALISTFTWTPKDSPVEVGGVVRFIAGQREASEAIFSMGKIETNATRLGHANLEARGTESQNMVYVLVSGAEVNVCIMV